MRTSTKIFLAIMVALAIPQFFLGRYILEGIKPTENGFIFSFSTLGYVTLALVALSTIVSTILFFRFIKMQKLSGALFFSVVPLTLIYGAFVSYVSSLNSVQGAVAQSVRAALNIGGAKANYNGYLWAGVATLVYLVLLFFTFMFMCRPVAKVGNVAESISQGRLKVNDYKIGGGKQFQSIEHSLNRINYNLKEKNERLRKVDFSKQKSVSRQFCRFMGKGNVLELECGHQVRKNACIMLCKLKNKENAQKQLSIEENFNFLSSYIKSVLPLVKKHNGFVDKYLGDGVLAVFERAEDGVECAQEICKIAKHRGKIVKNIPNVDVSISLHYSSAIFGIAEEEEKLPTIVSNNLEKLEKIQEINDFIGAKILISQDVVNALPQKYSFDHRFVGYVTIDERETSLYESLTSYSKRKRDKLIRFKNKFENAVQEFNSGKIVQAQSTFANVLHNIPDDKAAYVYFNSCEEKMSK